MRQLVKLIVIILLATTLQVNAHSEYVEAAKLNSKKAGFDEGMLNPADAYDWLTKETELGNYPAQTLLALMFQYGIYVEKDTDLALSMLLESASHQEAMAICLLADAFENGDLGLKADPDLAKWLSERVNNHFTDLALFDLSDFYNDINDIENEIKFIKKYLIKASVLSPSFTNEKMYRLGEIYYLGDDVNQDLNKAFELFKKAAESPEFPDENAMKRLSECYRYGRGTHQDIEKAEYWLQKAKEKGNGDAEKIVQLEKGVMLMGKEDYAGAYECFKSSQGDQYPKTLFCNGMMYYNGQKVQKDLFKAFELFTLAAEQSDDDSMYMLSECYRLGCGTSKNMEKADYWLKKLHEIRSEEDNTIKQLLDM